MRDSSGVDEAKHERRPHCKNRMVSNVIGLSDGMRTDAKEQVLLALHFSSENIHMIRMEDMCDR